MPKRKPVKRSGQDAAAQIIDANSATRVKASDEQRHSRYKAASARSILQIPAAKGSPEDSLCARCRTLDLDAIFSLEVKKDIGVHIRSLKATLCKLQCSPCSLCRLFASLAPQKSADTRCYLRAYSARRVFTRLHAKALDHPDATLLGVVGVKLIDSDMTDADSLGDTGVDEKIRESLGLTGYLHSEGYKKPQVPLLRVRLIDPQKFDVEFAQRCMTYCEENHNISCKPGDTSCMISRFFKLIDCENGMIINPPSRCHYATLSYVWAEAHVQGINDALDTREEDSFLSQFPKIISDSMLVTLRMGLKYLWVDKYCIDQDDDEAKRDQISQMDLIYANSRITIIAASSHSGPKGLPGVTSVCRKRHVSLEVLGHRLVSTLPNPKSTVGRSTWTKRGWTFQEGLLSRRCLIFTDEQVIFECSGMHCAECLDLPLEVMHDKQSGTFKAQIPPGPLNRKPLGNKPFDIMSYVLDFRKRELTFQSDKLNALEGVFHAFRESNHPVHHFIGIPIYPPVLEYGDDFPHKDIDRIPEERFVFALTWYHFEPGERDPNFPSWSWAGWTGGDLSEQSLINWTRKESLRHLRIWIELESGRQKGLRPRLQPFPSPDHLSSLQSLASKDPSNCCIHMEAICIPCNTAFFPSRTDEDRSVPSGGHYVCLKAGHDLELYLRANMDGELGKSDTSGLRLTAVLITNPLDVTRELSESETMSYVYYPRGVLILVEDHVDYFERVGICEITLSPRCGRVKNHTGWIPLSVRHLRELLNKFLSPTRIRLH